MKYFLFIFLFIILAVFGFGYWKFAFVYSEGDREGILMKFSKKGSAFKTYEGELLLPGISANNQQISGNYFYFSVEDPKVASILESKTGKTVRVHYIQYQKSLPWRGDNYEDKNQESGQYIVTKAE